MDTTQTTPDKAPAGMQPLTPLELNAIKLDVQHTVLTPGYLENISKGQ